MADELRHFYTQCRSLVSLWVMIFRIFFIIFLSQVGLCSFQKGDLLRGVWKWHSGVVLWLRKQFQSLRKIESCLQAPAPTGPVKMLMSKTPFWERQSAECQTVNVWCTASLCCFTQQLRLIRPKEERQLWVKRLLPETSAVLPPSSDTGILHSQDFIIWTLGSENRKTHGNKCVSPACCTLYTATMVIIDSSFHARKHAKQSIVPASSKLIIMKFECGFETADDHGFHFGKGRTVTATFHCLLTLYEQTD